LPSAFYVENNGGMQRDLNDLYYFVQVVDHGGFAPAGRALGVPKSKLSRRIALLEDQLGVRLLQRSTRRFQVTEIGQEYYHHCVAMLVEADAAEEAVDRTRSAPQGLVRLTCPSPILYFQIGEMIARFMTEYPRVRVELESTNRRVDVIAESVDVAIRIQSGPLDGGEAVVKVLADLTYRLVAHPRLLEGRAPMRVPPDLREVPSLDVGPPGRRHEWCLEGPDGATALVPHEPRLVTEDMVALRFAALEGVGVAQLPATVVRPDLLQGRLVEVLPMWAPRPEVVHAVFPSRRGLLPAVRHLLDFLADQFTALCRVEQAHERDANVVLRGSGTHLQTEPQDERSGA
jgi:DNA-binding transcriptional LysR family regulator